MLEPTILSYYLTDVAMVVSRLFISNPKFFFLSLDYRHLFSIVSTAMLCSDLSFCGKRGLLNMQATVVKSVCRMCPLGRIYLS